MVTLSLPGGNNPPDSHIPSVSSLCSAGVTTQLMTGILLQILRDHFSDPEMIENQSIRKKLIETKPWLPLNNSGRTAENSGILLETNATWTPNAAEKRPAVIVCRKTWQMGPPRGIGDHADTNVIEGNKDYLSFWNGSHVLACMGTPGAETEFLSTEVARLMVRFSLTLVEFMGVQRFRVSEIGEFQPLKEVKDNLGIPVVVAYVVPEMWSVEPDAPRLKKVVLKQSTLLNS